MIPGAASSWDISDDGRVYTFHLREALRWSNGDLLTADDFVYSFRRSADPATGSNYSSILAPIENAEAVVTGKLPPDRLGVQALDAHTLVIRTRARPRLISWACSITPRLIRCIAPASRNLAAWLFVPRTW